MLCILHLDDQSIDAQQMCAARVRRIICHDESLCARVIWRWVLMFSRDWNMRSCCLICDLACNSRSGFCWWDDRFTAFGNGRGGDGTIRSGCRLMPTMKWAGHRGWEQRCRLWQSFGQDDHIQAEDGMLMCLSWWGGDEGFAQRQRCRRTCTWCTTRTRLFWGQLDYAGHDSNSFITLQNHIYSLKQTFADILQLANDVALTNLNGFDIPLC